MEDPMEHVVRAIDHPLYQTLRDEDVPAFNDARGRVDALPSFAHGDFRGLDLRGLDARDLDLSNAYFRGADLRGIDFSDSQLEGASIAGAQISGCLFPRALHADEIVMSLNHGTRMRYNMMK
ncbi:pentapeptide repeat-containing protein [Marinobacter sp. JSM 1782161]|uniref:pentapeptide repeat-containing protein n=1 Tax=Marinobacter sp. JSM 1782161 TaxID=2685906 RepID=UPI00140367CC|nr:pentapeptide repeat-containing protein [Marinobacter sp. JSM 1782161]